MIAPFLYHDIEISTHDLTRRSTALLICSFIIIFYFNSRPHEEVDIITFVLELKTLVISTHDLTRRSTV